MQRYVEELAALGVAPPSTVPLYYRVDAGLLRGASAIAVMGSDTSGEVEAVLVALADELWVGLGSEHTDRAAGATSVALSKQLCRKPTAGELWCFDEVADHGDELTLRAHRVEAGEHKVYEEGTLAAMRPPHDLIGC